MVYSDLVSGVGCDSEPCFNGGVCFPGYTPESFACQCPPTFTGTQCIIGKLKNN